MDSVRFEKLFDAIRSETSRDCLSLDDTGDSNVTAKLPPTDITLIVGPEKIRVRAHKLVLWTRSEFFSALFTSKFADANSTEILLPLDSLGCARDNVLQVKRYLPTRDELSDKDSNKQNLNGILSQLRCASEEKTCDEMLDQESPESPLMSAFWDVVRYCYGLPVTITEGNCLALREMSGFFQIEQIHSHARDLITLITESICDRRTRQDLFVTPKSLSVWHSARINWINALQR